MIPIDYSEGRRLVESCVCGDCGHGLVLAWGGAYGVSGHVLLCPENRSHDTLKRLKGFWQMWRDGEELPPAVREAIEGKVRREAMQQGELNQEEVKTLVARQDANTLSRILQARFPQDLARAGAALEFAQWCIAHQLEPMRDCVPFQGTPYITMAWLDRQAAQDRAFKGYIYRIMDAATKKALLFEEGDLVVECEARWEGLEKPLLGLGVVRAGERETMTQRGTFRSPIVATHPQLMVFKRARAGAMKQRYHPPAPIVEELPWGETISVRTVEGASRPSTAKGLTPAPASVVSVGELAPEPQEGLAQAEVVEREAEGLPETEPPRAPSRDPATVKSLADFEKVAFQDWGLQPTESLQLCGYARRIDVNEVPWELYLKVWATKGEPKRKEA